MQIVIDIPEEEYRCVQITGCIGNTTCVSNAIYNGTPLPKGHGRLIDADEVANSYKSGNWDLHKVMKKAQTVLEAEGKEHDTN